MIEHSLAGDTEQAGTQTDIGRLKALAGKRFSSVLLCHWVWGKRCRLAPIMSFPSRTPKEKRYFDAELLLSSQGLSKGHSFEKYDFACLPACSELVVLLQRAALLYSASSFTSTTDIALGEVTAKRRKRARSVAPGAGKVSSQNVRGKSLMKTFGGMEVPNKFKSSIISCECMSGRKSEYSS